MNTRLIIRKTADTNYIPIKYAAVEMTPGAAAGTTYCLIQTIDVGWNTEANWDKWKTHKNPDGTYSNPAGRDPEGIQGMIGDLEVVALSTLIAYKPYTPSFDRQG